MTMPQHGDLSYDARSETTNSSAGQSWECAKTKMPAISSKTQAAKINLVSQSGRLKTLVTPILADVLISAQIRVSKPGRGGAGQVAATTLVHHHPIRKSSAPIIGRDVRCAKATLSPSPLPSLS